ncbi:MAG: hypothetical protein ND895_19960 [Pyrinomonadaceae bacterium]|nr:hypothetical protein [Pyrinomonadaceae bacterium]
MGEYRAGEIKLRDEEIDMANNGSDESKDMLYLVGGFALLVAGAGLIMAHPEIRKQVRAGLDRVLPGLQDNFNLGLTTVVPDFQRYMKIRSM